MIQPKAKYIFTALICCLIIACSEDSGSYDSYYSDSGVSGQGGSMARFTIKGDYMYTVDYSTLKTFDISDAEQPNYLKDKEQYMDFGIETIFTMDTLLLIGSQGGMYIYNITRPDFPQQMSVVSHIRSCDPVVAKDKHAYVTLNSSNIWCGRNSNLLQIYNIADPYHPILMKEQSGFKNPKGLGIDKNKLFICDNGVKVFNIDNPEEPVWTDDLSHIPEASGIDTYDVIPLDGILLVTGNDGFYQFDYSGEKLSFVSKIGVNRN